MTSSLFLPLWAWTEAIEVEQERALMLEATMCRYFGPTGPGYALGVPDGGTVECPWRLSAARIEPSLNAHGHVNGWSGHPVPWCVRAPHVPATGESAHRRAAAKTRSGQS